MVYDEINDESTVDCCQIALQEGGQIAVQAHAKEPCRCHTGRFMGEGMESISLSLLDNNYEHKADYGT
jgi:hypothetical protein